MSTPKFAVGEVVVLQSVTRPEFNGEHAVLMIPVAGETHIDPIAGIPCRIHKGEPFTYILDDLSMSVELNGHMVAMTWAESALRKKHQPGELSFTELMQTIKQGAKA